MPREDEEIKKELVDILFWDSRVDASDVNINVSQGDVTLSGTVPDYAMRKAAASDAWSASGTRSVNNKLTVQSLIRTSMDKQVQADAENILARIANINKENIRASVDSGWLTLKGEVDSFWKKIRAEELASVIAGVTGVTNELVVVPTEKADDQEIGEAVMRALARKENINEAAVHVKVENGVVSLSGSVPSWDAKFYAYQAAQNTVGVRDIEERLSVTP
jgi:osmotically-inducible protein OsmY